MNTIWPIIGAVFLLLLSLLGIQTKRVTKANDKVKEKDIELKTERIKVKVGQNASEIKDELISKKKENSKEKQEVLDKVDKLEGGELSEEVKVAAAAQSARAAARASKLSERSNGK